MKICDACNGSGEGFYDGSVCDYCNGLGEIYVNESEEKKNEDL